MRKFIAILIALSLIPIVLIVFGGTSPPDASGYPSVCTAPSGSLSKAVPEPLNSIATRAAQENDIPVYAVALIYFSENGRYYREPPPPYGKGRPWATSYAGAVGPFQFLRGTYRAFRNSNPTHKPGNVMDLTDAAYAAGAYLRRVGKLQPNSPIGSPNNPQKGTVMWAFGAYNAGPGGNFQNSQTHDYLVHAYAEYFRHFASVATQPDAKTLAAMIDLCKARQTSPNPGTPPKFGPTPAGSCPSGSSVGPRIQTIGIANPNQGPKILLCKVGRITVNATIATRWQWLIAKASSRGISLSGGGFRTYAQQISLRRDHCGTSHYAIFVMRARYCTPDTAIPGTSEHEKGRAVDLNMSRAVYQFMRTFGPRVGIYRTVPSEWWHWGVR